MKKQSFRKRLCCSVAAVLSLFAICGNNLHATGGCGPGDVSMVTNSSLQSVGSKKASKLKLTGSDGKNVRIADFPDRYIVINYWSSSSQESLEMKAELVRLEKKYPKSKVAFVFISVDENAYVAKQLRIKSVPEIYVKNPDGLVKHIKTNSSGLEEKMNELLK